MIRPDFEAQLDLPDKRTLTDIHLPPSRTDRTGFTDVNDQEVAS